MAHVARKFEHFLEIYRHAEGGRWSGTKLARVTCGVVHRSYVTNFHKGRIASPGFEKLAAIARAMGFPPANDKNLSFELLRNSTGEEEERSGEKVGSVHKLPCPT